MGDGLYWVTGSLLGDAGSSIAVIFLMLSSLFLITGASVRLVLMATGSRARKAALSAGRTGRQLGHTLTERRPVAPGEGQTSGGGAVAVAGAAADSAGPTPFGVDPASLSGRPAIGESMMSGAGAEHAPLDGAQTFPDIYQGKPALALVEPGSEKKRPAAMKRRRPASMNSPISAKSPQRFRRSFFPSPKRRRSRRRSMFCPSAHCCGRALSARDSRETVSTG